MRQKQQINGDNERQEMTMIIIRKTGIALLTILEGNIAGNTVPVKTCADSS